MSDQVSSRGDADAGLLRRRRRSASRSAPSAGRVASRSMPAWRLKASATVSRSGSANGSALRSRKVKRRAPAASRRRARSAACNRPSALVGPSRAIPFEHGEFGMVQRRRARGCGRRGRTRRSAARRRRAASCRRIPARCAGKRWSRAVRPPTSSVAKAWRWVSLPGETCRAGGLDLEEAGVGEIVAQRPHDRAPRQQERPAVGVDVRAPRAGSGEPSKSAFGAPCLREIAGEWRARSV